MFNYYTDLKHKRFRTTD